MNPRRVNPAVRRLRKYVLGYCVHGKAAGGPHATRFAGFPLHPHGARGHGPVYAEDQTTTPASLGAYSSLVRQSVTD